MLGSFHSDGRRGTVVKRYCALVLLAALSLSPFSALAFHKCVDAHGNVSFSDRACKEHETETTTETQPPTAGQAAESWPAREIRLWKAGCVEGVLAGARRDFAVAASRAGSIQTRFPEEQARKLSELICACLLERKVMSRWSREEFQRNYDIYSQRIIREATLGGECRPETFARKILAPEKD